MEVKTRAHYGHFFIYMCVCSVSYHAREDLSTNLTAKRYEALRYQRGPVSFQTRESSEGLLLELPLRETPTA